MSSCATECPSVWRRWRHEARSLDARRGSAGSVTQVETPERVFFFMS